LTNNDANILGYTNKTEQYDKPISYKKYNIHNKKIIDTKGSSNTSEVYEWLKDIFSKIDV
jgi:hypothetical protein